MTYIPPRSSLIMGPAAGTRDLRLPAPSTLEEKDMRMLLPGDKLTIEVGHDDPTPFELFIANFKGTVAYIKQLTFPRLDPHAVLRGRVISISDVHADDGDMNFNVIPDPEYQHMLYYKGKKRPHVVEGHAGERYETIHNEVKWWQQGKLAPQINEIRRLIGEGKTPLVETRGKWTFDWIHEGWVEVHPVKQIKILSPDARGS